MGMDYIVVEDMMTRDVVTCSPGESLLDVAKLMSSKKFSCVVIVEGDKPIGIVTERDLVEVLVDALQGVTWGELAIRNCMTSPIVSVDEDMTLDEVILLTHIKKIRHMPVVNIAGELVGILTQSNIIEGCYQAA